MQSVLVEEQAEPDQLKLPIRHNVYSILIVVNQYFGIARTFPLQVDLDHILLLHNVAEIKFYLCKNRNDQLLGPIDEAGVDVALDCLRPLVFVLSILVARIREAHQLHFPVSLVHDQEELLAVVQHHFSREEDLDGYTSNMHLLLQVKRLQTLLLVLAVYDHIVVVAVGEASYLFVQFEGFELNRVAK